MELLSNQTEKNDAQTLKLFFDQYEPAVDQVTEILDKLEEVALQRADEQSATADRLMETSWMVLIASVSVSVVLTLLMTFVIRKSILTPVREIVGVYDEMSKGHLKNVEIRYKSKDELGKMAQSIRKTNEFIISYLQDISDKLKMMPGGYADQCRYGLYR
jgi:methyl-accepting chemotaxis protein